MTNYSELYDIEPDSVVMALVDNGARVQRCVIRYPREYMPFEGTPEQVADALTKLRNSFPEYSRTTGWQLWYDVRLSKSQPAQRFYVAIWWEPCSDEEPQGPLMDLGVAFLRFLRDLNQLRAKPASYCHALIERMAEFALREIVVVEDQQAFKQIADALRA